MATGLASWIGWPLGNAIELASVMSQPRNVAGPPKEAAKAAAALSSSSQHLAYELFARFGRLFIYLVVALASYRFACPLEAAAVWAPGWVGLVLFRNLAIMLLFYGGWHAAIYDWAYDALFARGLKFNPLNQYAPSDGTAPLWAVRWRRLGGLPVAPDLLALDNLSRERLLTTAGFLQATVFECLVLHLWATGTPRLMS